MSLHSVDPDPLISLLFVPSHTVPVKLHVASSPFPGHPGNMKSFRSLDYLTPWCRPRVFLSALGLSDY